VIAVIVAVITVALHVVPAALHHRTIAARVKEARDAS
jgi:hypothetical protein